MVKRINKLIVSIMLIVMTISIMLCYTINVIAEENTIPSKIFFGSHPDSNVKIYNSEKRIKLIGKLEGNHIPAAFTIDPKIADTKSDLKEDKISFKFKLSNYKMTNGEIDSTAYFVYGFRNSVASDAPWSSNFAVFLLFFKDKIMFRISDGSSDENAATYRFLNGVNLIDDKEHKVDIKINDAQLKIDVIIDENEKTTINFVTDEDDNTNDVFNEKGGMIFLTHFLTAEISEINCINTKEAPPEDGGGEFKEDNETLVNSPLPVVHTKNYDWLIILILIVLTCGIVSGLGIAIYGLFFKSQKKIL